MILRPVVDFVCNLFVLFTSFPWFCLLHPHVVLLLLLFDPSPSSPPLPLLSPLGSECLWAWLAAVTAQRFFILGKSCPNLGIYPVLQELSILKIST